MSMEQIIRRIGFHEGPNGAFLGRYEQAAAAALNEGPRGYSQFMAKLPEWIADERNLHVAWEHLRLNGGYAAGPNGRTWSDYSSKAHWELLRALRDALRAGLYKHGPLRKKKIPKRPGSNETRTLWLANIEDRVVARAAKQILEPLFDPKFESHSFCRRWRSTQHALAYAESLTQREGRHSWISEDMRDAFDRVPKSRLLDIVRKYLPSDEVRGLLDRIVASVTGNGLPQGSPLSPLLMNLYLHHTLDKPWRKKHPSVPLLRYMDDLLLLCRPGDHLKSLYADLKQLLVSIGMIPKYGFETAVRNVRTDNVNWLGYLLSYPRGEMEIRLEFENERSSAGQEYLKSLYQKFVLLHARPDAALRAPALLEGIIQYAGPALPYSNTRRIWSNLTDAARQAAFEEMPTYTGILQQWEGAHARWEKTRIDRVLREIDGPAKNSSRPWKSELVSTGPADGTGFEDVFNIDDARFDVPLNARWLQK